MDLSSLTTWLLILSYPFPLSHPTLIDLNTLPRHEHSQLCLGMAAAHRKWCERRKLASAQGSDERFKWVARCEEAEETRLLWTILTYATDAGKCDGDRRMFLNSLRSALGCNDFYRGKMPCPIPSWRVVTGDMDWRTGAAGSR